MYMHAHTQSGAVILTNGSCTFDHLRRTNPSLQGAPKPPRGCQQPLFLEVKSTCRRTASLLSPGGKFLSHPPYNYP